MTEFHTLAPFNLCRAIRRHIKHTARTAERQVSVPFFKNKPNNIFTGGCRVAAADRAAYEAELYIDLLAVPGKASAVLHDPGDGGPEGSAGRRMRTQGPQKSAAAEALGHYAQSNKQ